MAGRFGRRVEGKSGPRPEEITLQKDRMALLKAPTLECRRVANDRPPRTWETKEEKLQSKPAKQGGPSSHRATHYGNQNT